MTIETFMDDLKRRGGASTRLAAPLWLRWAWSLKVMVPPPLFWSPMANFVFHAQRAATIVLVLTMANRLLGNRALQEWSLTTHLGVALLAGSGVGLLASWYYPKKSKALKLPQWHSYIAT